jgi:hypothetical protein
VREMMVVVFMCIVGGGGGGVFVSVNLESAMLAGATTG